MGSKVVLDTIDVHCLCKKKLPLCFTEHVQVNTL